MATLVNATLDLNCWVIGDPHTRVFPVKILNTETVGSLKKVIKDENPESFSNVDARSLDLWKVRVFYLFLQYLINSFYVRFLSLTWSSRMS